MALPLAILTAPNAFAGSTPPFDIGPNGSAVVPGSDGGTPLTDLFGSVKELGPLNSNTTKIGVIHNDVPPTLGLTNPNAQVDLRQAWLNTAKDSSGDDWIYFAWERDSNSGSGFIAYEFMKNAAPTACAFGPTQDDTALIANCNPWANRSGPDATQTPPAPGDFMILWDQQGGSRDLYLRVWSGTAPNLTLGAPQLLDANVSAAAYSADGFRGEAAINITDAIYGGVSRCLAFANIIPSTVTGNSDTADYKDTILTSGRTLSNCTTTTTTTPRDAAGAAIPATGVSITTAGVVQVKDSALIALTGGSANPGGTIDFTLCRANDSAGNPSATPPVAATATCDTINPVSVLVGNDVVVSDPDGAYPVTVTSPSAWVTAAGRYCWKAEYTGVSSAGIGGSSDVSTGECFKINPVTPLLTTDAGNNVTLGTAITDTASLTGTAPEPTSTVIHTSASVGPRIPAGGSITFTLFGPSTGSCGSQVTAATQSVPVTGDNTSYGPASFTPTSAGDYHWKASYNGDSPNTAGTSHNATCGETGEDVTVSTVPSSLVSDQTWVPSDSVTVSASAGGPLAGTVSFEFFTNGTCAGSSAFSTTKSVAGASSQTVLSGNAPAQTATGSFSWRVSYTSTNPAQRSIAASCHETSALTVTNGGTISSS
ncbi:hemagglutinin [Humibacillus xanthopallidus]|uniref:hemagglutinin n=1 Tax=Humibacillus xanthopallidus TaxID=412689 RepID=UPI0031D1D455